MDPKATPKSVKKQTKNLAKIKIEKRPYLNAFPLIFEENVMLKPKWPIFKKRAKTLCFCAFFEHTLLPRSKKNDLEATKHFIENHIEK